MPIISGVLKDGAGQPIAGCTIQLKAVNTTSAVIMTTTARVGVTAGAYRIEALPARYEVTLAVEDFPPQKVGIIDVYADSPDGSLNDFMMAVKGDYLVPDVIRQFQLMVQQARESAESANAASQGVSAIKDAAETAASGAALSEKNASDSALAAKGSETNAADSVVKAAASAAAALASQNAAKLSETNAGQGASDAALSATKAADSALSAGKSATDAAGHATGAQKAATNAETSAAEARQAALDAQQAAVTAAGDVVASAVPVAVEQVKAEIAGNVTRAENAAIKAAASEQASTQQALAAQTAAEEARKSATTAAGDAVASAVPEAVRQLTAAVGENTLRAETAATSAEAANTGAQRALEEARLIAKTPGAPGQSAWDIWKSQQPAGADTSLTAYIEFQKGKDGSATIPAFGEVGSYVLGLVPGTEYSPAGAGIFAGEDILVLDAYKDTGTPPEGRPAYRNPCILAGFPGNLAGQWQLMTSREGSTGGLFQRVR